MLLPLAPHELAEIILELKLVPLFQLGLDSAMEHELELELVEGLGTLLRVVRAKSISQWFRVEKSPCYWKKALQVWSQGFSWQFIIQNWSSYWSDVTGKRKERDILVG